MLTWLKSVRESRWWALASGVCVILTGANIIGAFQSDTWYGTCSGLVVAWWASEYGVKLCLADVRKALDREQSQGERW